MPVALILKGYPRLSETFIAQEIHALEQAGVALHIYALRRPTDSATHPLHRAIRAGVTYLPEYLHRAPWRVLCAWWRARRRPAYRALCRLWWRDFKRDPSRNRIRRLGQAFVLCESLPPHTRLIYAHFLHTPASVARYAALLRGLPWSCSAHAKDIWTLPEWEKREKLADCCWLTTCTRANLTHLRALADDPAKVTLNYHGIDLSRFSAAAPPTAARDGADPHAPVRIISVGRVVAKKGYAELLDALAALPPNLHWQLIHIGDGPLRTVCKRRAAQHGLQPRIHWLGAQPQQAVIDHYRDADFFVLNCCITADGDRDGLPNVLLEAQGMGLAVVATRISGIPELVEDGVNGVLVETGDGAALTDALHRLITDPALRRNLGATGQSIVRERFDKERNFVPLYRLVDKGRLPD